VNYLARLGHRYAEEGYLQLADLATQFSVERLGRAPAHFDKHQLKHWQQTTVSAISSEKLWAWMGKAVHDCVPESLKTDFIEAVKPNSIYPQDALYWANLLFNNELIIQAEAQTEIVKAGREFFKQARIALESTQADYPQMVNQLKISTGMKGKDLFMPLRAALTGETHGPELARLLPLMGMEKAKKRLEIQ
jgi:nondiscriminating glutamyl-tRNA synthetase